MGNQPPSNNPVDKNQEARQEQEEQEGVQLVSNQDQEQDKLTGTRLKQTKVKKSTGKELKKSTDLLVDFKLT